MELHGLLSGQDIFYRIWFEDVEKSGRLSEPAIGRFRTAPNDKRDVSVVWPGDTAGQGWGINPDFGGMRIYETMRQTQATFFIHSGDSIYAEIPTLVQWDDHGTTNNWYPGEVGQVPKRLETWFGSGCRV